MKLQYRVPLLIIGIMIATGLVTAALMLHFQKKAAEGQFEEVAESIAEEVRSNLEHEMLEGGDQPHVQQAMDRVESVDMVNEVVIFGRNVEIFSSGKKEEIGTIRDDEKIREVLRTGKVVKRKETQYGRPELCVITPIFNKPECYACHGSDHEIRGAIEVGIDTRAVTGQQREQTLIMGALGGLSFLLVGGMVTYTLRRTVFNPLSRLGASAQRISAGDYTARAEVEKDDEVGVLAQTFNEMAQRVQDHTEELARWNEELEQRVEQRTRELSALNAVIAAASESLDLDEILNHTLDKVLSTTEMEAGAVYLLGEETSRTVIARDGATPEQVETMARSSMDECLEGRIALVSPQTLQKDDGDQEPASHRAMAEAGFQTQVSVPIASKGKVLGALCLFGRRSRQFSDEEVQLLASMGEALGVGVENAQVAKRLREANTELSALFQQAMEGGFDVAFDNPHLVQCWEEVGCQSTDCPAYGSENLRCWQIAGTLCKGESQGEFAQKLGSCTDCEVYQKSCQRDEITAIGESFNNMMLLLKLEAQRREEMRGQLVEELISAQEEERKRIARELHDQTSQSLTSLIVGLKTLETASRDRKIKERAAELQTMSQRALDEVHRLSMELRPAALDELGLVAALRSYLKESSQRFNINTSFTTAGLKGRPAPSVETTIYRIVQEAVTNVIKHAEAKNVSIRLEQRDSSIRTTIEDDGKGFDVQSVRSWTAGGKGLGLIGMSERAVLVGGTFSVDSQPGRGTRLFVEIPLAARGGADG